MQITKLILGLLLATTFMSCSKTDDKAATSSSSANIVSQVYSNLQAATPDFSSSSFAGNSFDDISMQTAIGTNLSTANTFPDVDNPGSITKTGIEYLGTLLGNVSQNSVFWRAKMPFLIACTIDALATKGDALYDTSQTSVVLAQSVVGPCGEESDFTGGDNSSLIGTTVTMTIADLATTTYYDQMITMLGSSNSQFGGNDQYIYVRNNSTTLNFMHVELNSGNTQVSINTVHFDKANNKGHYQYVSFSSGGGQYMYRIYMDKENNMSRVVTFWKQTSSPAHTIATHIGSTFENQTSANLSISYLGLGNGSAQLDNGNGCVDLTSTPPSISSDNTTTCGSTTIDQIGTVSSGHAFGTAIAALSGSAIRTWASTAASGATKYPDFDETSIESAGLGF